MRTLPFPRLALGLALLLPACTFNFELTSQRTALENQVMGTYKELDDDLVLISAVRGPSGDKAARAVPEGRRRALDARQNQQFNRDDIDELKGLGALGEGRDGTLVYLGDQRASAGATKSQLALAQSLAREENRDRETIWDGIIAANANLHGKDLPEVRRTYAKIQREQAQPGQWYQDDAGAWRQKPQGQTR